MPRRSRRVAGKDALESLVDAEPLENHGTGEEVIGATMLHQTTGNTCANRSMFKLTTQENHMLKEAVRMMKNTNEPKWLENYITGFLLISAKGGISKYGDKDVEALLKEFFNSMTRKRS